LEVKRFEMARLQSVGPPEDLNWSFAGSNTNVPTIKVLSIQKSYYWHKSVWISEKSYDALCFQFALFRFTDQLGMNSKISMNM